MNIPKKTEEFDNMIKEGKKIPENAFLKESNVRGALEIFFEKNYKKLGYKNRTDFFEKINEDPKNGTKYIRASEEEKSHLSRDKVVKILIALKADLETIQKFLKEHKYQGLYSKFKNEAIIMDGIYSQKNLKEINDNLSKENFSRL